MSKRAKLLIGAAGILLLVVVCILLFFRYEIRKSFPQTGGTIVLKGLQARVEVLRDEFGVPRISASNDHDLMMALGYVHAQDRLWQMDMARRAAEGRLSELFGGATLPFDKMFRIVGLMRAAEAIERAISPESRQRLEWYAAGVNEFIASHKGKYPLEFDLLRYEPEPWQPVHSILIGRLMAWELNLSWWSDLTLGAIAEKVGLEKALDIFPTYPSDVAPIVPAEAWRTSASLRTGYEATARQFCAAFGVPAMAGGSNAWVVRPAKSATGGTLLANDTHLQLQLPPQWYEVQLQAPGCNVSGMSIAGVPGIVAGRNDRIAWGLTNVMADDADFYIEKIDTTDTTRYLYDGQWRPLTLLRDNIQVRGEPDVPLTVRLTEHGPIVTDIRIPIKKSVAPYVASMRWTGAGIDDQIDAFNKIDRASNWEEFKAGVREFAVPGQNFVYGDVDGNIGYWCGVKLPIRGKQNSLFPLPGWDKSTEWQGFVPFDRLPHLYNPPEGYIATANNKIVDDSYPYHISDLWEPPSRIVRLRDVLGVKDQLFSVEDFERLQYDSYSENARRILPYVLAAFKDSALNVPGGEKVFDYLRNWNFRFAKEDVATSIYQEFFVRLLNNIYRDEMGDDLFHDFVILVNIPIRVTTRLLEEGTSPWFDDVRTPEIETRDDMIRKSLREAVADLLAKFGSDSKTWRWGELHTVTLRHPLGLVKPLDRIFNLGPYPFPGGSTSLISGEYSYNEPFAVTVAASFRQVFDLANGQEYRAVITSGQSGQAFSDHYSDQTELWLNGGYRIVRRTGTEGFPHQLHLEPAR